MNLKKKPILFILLASLAFSAFLTQPSFADRWVRGRAVDWNRGRWIHDRHGGRLGWWWVVGPSWYYYPRPHSFIVPQPVVVQQQPPVVIQQAPPPVVVQQAPQPVMAPPPSPVLYYCKATGTHYPETMSCPGGWSTMTAETPPQPADLAPPAGAPQQQ